MANDFQQDKTAEFTGLGTFATAVLSAGYYALEIEATIPWSQTGTPGVPRSAQVTNVTCVADVSGSLNSTYWTFRTADNVTGYYVWYNINSAGVDPAVAGLTGIAVAAATDATANTIAGNSRTAIAAVSGISARVTVSGATSHVILTNVQNGAATNAANGTASPGFSYAITAGTAGSGTGSGLSIVASLQGSPVLTLNNPTPSQAAMGGSVRMLCAAGDALSIVFSSSNDVDLVPNAIKSSINFYKKLNM